MSSVKKKTLSLHEMDRRCKALGVSYGRYEEMEIAGILPEVVPKYKKPEVKKHLDPKSYAAKPFTTYPYYSVEKLNKRKRENTAVMYGENAANRYKQKVGI